MRGIERVTSRGSRLEQRRPEARPGWATQTALLTRRSLLNVSRNWGQNVGFLFQALVCVVLSFEEGMRITDDSAGLESRWVWRSTCPPRRPVGFRPSKRSSTSLRESFASSRFDPRHCS